MLKRGIVRTRPTDVLPSSSESRIQQHSADDTSPTGGGMFESDIQQHSAVDTSPPDGGMLDSPTVTPGSSPSQAPPCKRAAIGDLQSPQTRASHLEKENLQLRAQLQAAQDAAAQNPTLSTSQPATQQRFCQLM